MASFLFDFFLRCRSCWLLDQDTEVLVVLVVHARLVERGPFHGRPTDPRVDNFWARAVHGPTCTELEGPCGPSASTPVQKVSPSQELLPSQTVQLALKDFAGFFTIARVARGLALVVAGEWGLVSVRENAFHGHKNNLY